jgi:hypothetical protein
MSGRVTLCDFAAGYGMEEYFKQRGIQSSGENGRIDCEASNKASDVAAAENEHMGASQVSEAELAYEQQLSARGKKLFSMV